ncbi:MAG: PH domain-containing protein [Desulfuromonadales bacterium]|nr:PH domain-containing protein [Desulfuromonadales bacterium]
MTEKHDLKENFLSTSERILKATKKGFHSASFKANQYKKIVQKKIDLNAIQKKIDMAHTDLGRSIDNLQAAEVKVIMTQPEVKELLSQLDTLRHSAVDLIAAIERLKNEEETIEPTPTAQPVKSPDEEEPKE